MANALQALFGNGQDPQQVPTVDEVTVPGQPPAPQAQQTPMTPGPMDQQLMGAPRPQMDPAQAPQMNYDNSQQSRAVNDAVVGEGTPRGGSANPGVYGLLPQHLQHGTLRNVLGALGDAFLTGSNRPAQYRPRMEQQEIGNAMAGINMDDPQSVAAAVQRVAATGAPGSVEMADKIQQQASQAALRRATMEQTALYRESMTSSRHDQSLQRMVPYVGGMVSAATDKPSYAAAYQRAEAIAQRIGPEYHASDFGLVAPEDWTPEASAAAGLTHNNIVVSSDKAAGRAQAGRDTDVNARSRIEAAGMNNTGRVQAATIGANRPSDVLRRRELGPKIDAGTATPAEVQEWNHLTQVSGTARRPAKGAGVAPPIGNLGSAAGTTAGVNSGVVSQIPQPSDIAYLQAHPHFRAGFDAHFGPGASARVLGH